MFLYYLMNLRPLIPFYFINKYKTVFTCLNIRVILISKVVCRLLHNLITNGKQAPKTACFQPGAWASGAWGLGTLGYAARSELLMWLLALRLPWFSSHMSRFFYFKLLLISSKFHSLGPYPVFLLCLTFSELALRF